MVRPPNRDRWSTVTWTPLGTRTRTLPTRAVTLRLGSGTRNTAPRRSRWISASSMNALVRSARKNRPRTIRFPNGTNQWRLARPGWNLLQATRGGGEFGPRWRRQHQVGSSIELLEAQLADPGGPHQGGQGGAPLLLGHRELLAVTGNHLAVTGAHRSSHWADHRGSKRIYH